MMDFRHILLATISIFLSSFLWAQDDINMQDGEFSQCSGMLYDSGGPDEDYENDENYTLTLCPDNDEEFSQLEFTEFDLSPGDQLEIYNADSADPDYLIGTYTSGNNTDDLGTIKATTESPSSCLTLVFTSNASGTSYGFAAEISCTSNDIFLDEETDYTTYNQCSGKLYDHDPDGSTIYNFNGTRITTICSDDPSLVTQIDFLDFRLPGGYSLKIYDGNNPGAPLIGTYTGNNSPGIIAASDDNFSGCLTFEYTGAGAVVPTNFGWEADINCVEPCQQIDVSLSSVSPSIEDNGNYKVPKNQFLNFVLDVDFEESGDGATYNWDFDGTPSGPFSNPMANHSFTSEGIKVITVTVTDANGCTKTFTFHVEVMPNVISVYDDLYTIEELVRDVLIGSDCAQVSNIVGITGTDFGYVNGIGYFE